MLNVLFYPGAWKLLLYTLFLSCLYKLRLLLYDEVPYVIYVLTGSLVSYADVF